MKVDFNREAIEREPFDNIEVGECFVVDLDTPDQTICIKIMGAGDELDNAVDLQGGSALHFDDDEEVVPLSAELKVRLGG